MSQKKRIYPLINRPTPLLDTLEKFEPIKERPLLGILASTPEEIRSLRRSVVAAVASALVFAAYGGYLLKRLPAPTT